MSSSNQTEADRRVLRRRQRELQNDIVMGVARGNNAAVDGKDANSGEVGRLREQNNELWQNVHFTREAVLDSENVDLITNKAAREAEKIVQVPRYDAIRMAQSLVKKGKGTLPHFNWNGLGFQVGVCFNSLPNRVSFLYGALDAEYTPKERKKPERRQKQARVESEDEEDEQPEDVDQTGKKKNSDGNELSAVEKHIKVIRKTLGERAYEEHDEALRAVEEYESQLSQANEDEHLVKKKTKKFLRDNSHVHAVNMLFNPKSFTQTVENIFHFSFLVKEGFSGVRARSLEEAEEYGGVPGPVVRPVKDGEKMPPPKQAILSLNMKDWKDMCQAFDVEESDVPHRVDGKIGKKQKRERKSK